MAVLHSNTTFDPEERAVAIITELEKEVRDDDELVFALHVMMDVFQNRQEYSRKKVNEEAQQRVKERRRDRDAARLKGISPAPLTGRVIQAGGVIPSRH